MKNNNNLFIQRGENPKYPYKIKTWRLGEDVPEWISDNAKIQFLDGEGNITLSIIETNTGGFEIIKSDGSGVLVRLNNKRDYVCISDESITSPLTIKDIFPLTEHQLNLLYKPIEIK